MRMLYQCIGLLVHLAYPEDTNFLIDSLKFCLSRNYFRYGKLFFLQTRGVAMGARFASRKKPYLRIDPELVCYQRYIDDLIKVWDGDKSGLDTFMQRLNANNKNITLTWNVNTEQTFFLDLDISKDGERIKMADHFKLTGRNAFIPVESCHHSKWLCNNPRGQFILLRRNCLYEGDFISSSGCWVLAEGV